MILDTKTAKEAKIKMFIWPLYYMVAPVFIQTDEFEFTIPLISLPLGSFFSTALSESESNRKGFPLAIYKLQQPGSSAA
jgi:hypothetical protein